MAQMKPAKEIRSIGDTVFHSAEVIGLAIEAIRNNVRLLKDCGLDLNPK